MKAQQVNITISGIAGSGRLSITYLIKKLLKENNFEVDFKINQSMGFRDENDFDRKIGINNENAIKVLPEITKIVLEDKQLPHQPYNKYEL